MDFSSIVSHIVEVTHVCSGMELTMEGVKWLPKREELARTLQDELGHEVSVTFQHNKVILSPKGHPVGGLITFRERVGRLFDPWANKTELDGWVPNLPEE